MGSHFFAYMYRMRYIRRWGLMKNSCEENLAEHSLDTALIAHALGSISKWVLGRQVNPDECACAALYHDAPEILTGDLPTPVKYFNPEIREAYKKVEQNASEKLLSMLPQEMRGEYDRLFAMPKENLEVGAIVHWADRLCAYIKCLEELKSGNGEFKMAAQQIKNDLDSCQREDVRYFAEHFLPAFELTLDELN